ncbi:MAG: class I SAM-dependent methyltransferase [Chlorobi bacterium]|nr:class I SAM-dependent methyltransferase [Chlorobiota bacterium]
MKSAVIGHSCNVNDKVKSRRSAETVNELDLKEHWDKVYSNNPENKLGWYETDLSPMLKLIMKAAINKSARILIVGAGSTTLVDELLDEGYSNIIASDISEVALKKLAGRTVSNKVEFIADDLTKPTRLGNIGPVDLWIDRAVLHFFTKESGQNTYFDLLKSKIRSKAYVILAEFDLNGAKLCSGLPVQGYSEEMLTEKLGTAFELIDSFDHTYIMPSGAERPYIYTLFRKKHHGGK